MPPRRRARPTEPPANAGAAVGRQLDNVGRSAADAGRAAARAPIVGQSQRAAISAGSIIVGLIAYAIGINYLQHGWPGVTALLKAKLMNKTSQSGNGVTPAMYFHTGGGAAAGPAAGTQLAATPTPPASPTAPTPSGGTLYA